MKKFRFSLLSVLLIGLTNITAQAQELKVPLNPKVKTGQLENGLKYYILENSKPENKVELRLVVNAGSILESDAQQGLAHFCEHMAFNGTENFKKNELVDYLQSVGVKFGAHLNAYTSFDETVYMLSIPSDDKDILEKGFLIMKDWAGGVSYEGDEIDKERGVVLEEYRLSLGADNRMMKEYLPKLLYNSQYAKRLPIGKKDILENFDHKEARQFYEDWYRPDLMAVIVVGDVDEKYAEDQIRKLFSGLKNPANPKKRTVFDIPDHGETFASVVEDKEATYNSVQLIIKQNGKKEVTGTIEEYKSNIKRSMFSRMLSARLSEITNQPDAPFSYAWSYLGRVLSRSKEGYNMTAIAKDGMSKECFERLVIETERVKRYGFKESELKRAIKDYRASLEAAVREMNTTESRRYLSAFQNNFLSGSPAPDAAWKLEQFNETIKKVSLEQINELAEEWIHKGNTVFIMTGPEGQERPDEGSVIDFWKNSESLKIAEYEDQDLPDNLIDNVPRSGSITSTKKINEVGLTEMTLSNGATVLYKKTDYKADQVMFTAFSKGGLSLVGDEDFHKVRHGMGVVGSCGVGDFSENDLEKILSGKRVGVTPYIGGLSEGMRGSCAPKDMDAMFQLIHLFFTQPRMDEEAFETYKNKQLSFTKNMESNPRSYFNVKWNEFINEKHPRNWKLAKEEDWAKTDYASIYRITKERFANAGDFTFVFVGNLDEAKLKQMVEQYLCPLPSGKKENYVDQGMKVKKGADQLTIKKGSEPQSLVRIYFGGEAKYSAKDDYYLKALGEVLAIKLTESLREEMSGVYGSSAYGGMQRHPNGEYYFIITFPCGPENVNALKDRALAELQKIIDEGPTEKDVKKIKEAQLRDYKVNLESNRYWMNHFRKAYYNGDDVKDILQVEQKINALKGSDIQGVGKKYLSGDYFIGILLPE